MTAGYTVGEVATAAKARDAWWTVLVADPVAIRLTTLVANGTRITPNQLTALSGLVGSAAAGGFLLGGPVWRVVGVALFLAAFLLGCMDGKLARLTGTATVSGAWLDSAVSRLVRLACALALLLGEYSQTGKPAFLWLAVLVASATFGGAILASRPVRGDVPLPVVRLRTVLARWRLRGRPVSEIEFAMAVCVAAPLTGAYLPVIGVAAALFLAFELAATVLAWPQPDAVEVPLDSLFSLTTPRH